MNGKLIIVSGPSGVGKHCLIDGLILKLPYCKLSISATTREPREGEIHGKDYHFLSRDEFEGLIRSGELLEFASVHGNYYGTPMAEIEEEIAAGHTIILEIDVQGACQVKKKIPSSVSVFITPPTPEIETLRARLSTRGTEVSEVIERRLQTAREELVQKELFDTVIVNDSLDCAVTEMVKLVETLKTHRGVTLPYWHPNE